MQILKVKKTYISDKGFQIWKDRRLVKGTEWSSTKCFEGTIDKVKNLFIFMKNL